MYQTDNSLWSAKFNRRICPGDRESRLRQPNIICYSSLQDWNVYWKRNDIIGRK